MEKKLSEMSLEELWKLFPIYLTEHQPYWKEWYTDEESFLKNRVPKIAVSYTHLTLPTILRV